MPILYNLVEIGFRRVGDGLVFPVNCRVCGENVQVTGQGGFSNMDDAAALAKAHRIEHMVALVHETGLQDWTDGDTGASLVDLIEYARDGD